MQIQTLPNFPFIDQKMANLMTHTMPQSTTKQVGKKMPVK